MLRGFNAFQLVGCFAAWPFLVEWLHTADFAGAAAAFWLSIIMYVVGFVAMCSSVYDFSGK